MRKTEGKLQNPESEFSFLFLNDMQSGLSGDMLRFSASEHSCLKTASLTLPLSNL